MRAPTQSHDASATSLSKAIFLPNFLLSITALVAVSGVLTLVVGRLTSNSVEDRLQTTQRLFIETISEDYLTGSYSRVYRKCKSLISDKLIKGVKISGPNGEAICDITPPENQKNWKWTQSGIYHDEANTQIAAQVSLAYSTEISRQIFLNTFFVILGAIAATAFVQFLLSRKVAISISSPITNLADSLDHEGAHLAEIPSYQGGRFFRKVREVSVLFESIRKLFGRIEEYQKQLVTKTRQAAVGEMAAQVAHDIRSPLAALESVVDDIEQLPEEHRILVRSATGRVRDIANDLLRQKSIIDSEGTESQLARDSEDSAKTTSVWLLSSLVDSLISEKRFQFRSKIGIDISAKLGNTAYGLFALVDPTRFKAVLSNLINNSVEAMESRGSVTVTVAPDDAQHLLITVEDTGKGVPQHILPKLMQEGESFNKPDGSGLGLYGARVAVESWKGTIHIASTLGKGTTVTIRLPRAATPAWFVPNLQIESASRVVVLDDDASIHQIWQSRFDALQAKGTGAVLHHATSPQELADWISGHPGDLAKTLFLVDFELLGYTETGIDLIEKHHIADRSILVTSRYEDKAILDRLAQLRVRLIPKGLAPFVPILVADSAAPVLGATCVLIDDDTMIHKTWKLAAKKAGQRVAYFFSAAEFLAQAEGFDKGIPIYIDSQLGNGVRGEEVSQEIFALGFREIYLITGYSEARFPELPHIRAILGKRAPW